MNIDKEHSVSKIKTFLAIVKHGSIRSASENLGLDPSTVSRQLSSLESDLGILLIRRSSRKLSVTAVGQKIAEHYGNAIDELKNVEELSRSMDIQKDIFMTIPTVFGNHMIMRFVEAYITENPDVRIHIDWSDEKRDPIESKIDLGIRGGYLDSDNVVAQQLSELKLAFIVSPKLLKRYPDVTEISHLEQLPWIKINQAGRDSLPPLRGNLSLNIDNITDVPLTVNSQQAAIDAATRGLGVVVVEKLAVLKAIEEGNLVELFPDSINSVGYYWLYKPDGRWLQPHVREFSDYLIHHLRTSESATEKVF